MIIFFRSCFVCFGLVALFCFAPAFAQEGAYKQIEAAYERQDYETVFKLLLPIAQAGDSIAQLNLAKLYQQGLGQSQNYAQAASWFKLAANQDNLPAQHNLANLYATGLGVEQDYHLASNWYRKAAENNYAPSQHALALLLEKNLVKEGANTSEVLQWYQKAAEQGFVEAQTSLGVIFQEGEIITADYERARFWYTKAAEQGDARALNNLGTIYTKALGVDQNYEIAAHYYRQAAEKEFSIAMTNLGVLYENGFGVAQSDETAIYWYRKAGGQSRSKVSVQASSSIEGLEEISIDQLKALANVGNRSAQFKLALLYRDGKGVLQDYVTAYKWLNLAIASGEVEAIEYRDSLAKLMTTNQINEAQKLAREWGFIKSNN